MILRWISFVQFVERSPKIGAPHFRAISSPSLKLSACMSQNIVSIQERFQMVTEERPNRIGCPFFGEVLRRLRNGSNCKPEVKVGTAQQSGRLLDLGLRVPSTAHRIGTLAGFFAFASGN